MRRDELIDQRPSRTEQVTSGTLLPTQKWKENREWHPIAKKLWKAFGTSGQVSFWQDSDWALAFSLCDDLSRFKRQEDAAEKTRRIAESWDRDTEGMSPDERQAAGFPRNRPLVASYGPAAKMDVIYRTSERLLLTEADRRRARIELQAPMSEDDPVVDVMKEYREQLAASG